MGGVAAALLYFVKQSAFVFIILIGVGMALMFPHHITDVNGYATKGLIISLLQLIMFGMGTAISIEDFRQITKHPKPVFIGVSCQFLIMPIVGVVLVTVFALPPEIAAGVVLVGCSPSGLASNVMAYLSNANLALSVSLTICATLIAPLLTPLLMQLLAGELVEMNVLSMMQSMFKLVVLPVVIGVALNHFFRSFTARLNNVLPLVSMGGITVIIAIIVASAADQLVTIGGALILICILHNAIGFLLGYCVAKLSGMDNKSARTISLEVGLQNSGLASALALQLGKMTTMGLAPAIFSVVMNINGAVLANYWKSKNTE